jgi:hypothetical protein
VKAFFGDFGAYSSTVRAEDFNGSAAWKRAASQV